MQRILSIDYLRGLMALSVMIYHFYSWSFGVPSSEYLLGKLGVYAVSIFYVISGISLYLVYSGTRWNSRALFKFATKRILRIGPTYWLATSLMILLGIISNSTFTPDWPRYASNYLLIFGLYNPRDYIPTGGWSIGNEVAFYFLFPILIISTRNKFLFLGTLAALFSLHAHYAFFELAQEKTLAEEWSTYINPLNQVFLFAMGVYIAWTRKNTHPLNQNITLVILTLSLGLFAFLPATGNQINIVTGVERIYFTLCCGGICYGCLNINFTTPQAAARILKFLGDTSYASYLLHGVLTAYGLKYIFPLLNDSSASMKLIFLTGLIMPLTFLLSHLVYRYIEIPAINVGKHLDRVHTVPKDLKQPA